MERNVENENINLTKFFNFINHQKTVSGSFISLYAVWKCKKTFAWQSALGADDG